MTTDDDSPPQTCGLLFLFLWLIGASWCLFLAQWAGVFNFARWPHFGRDFLFQVWVAMIVLVQGLLLFDVARDCISERRAASELMSRVVFASIGIPFIEFGGCLFLWSIK